MHELVMWSWAETGANFVAIVEERGEVEGESSVYSEGWAKVIADICPELWSGRWGRRIYSVRGKKHFRCTQLKHKDMTRFVVV